MQLSCDASQPILRISTPLTTQRSSGGLISNVTIAYDLVYLNEPGFRMFTAPSREYPKPAAVCPCTYSDTCCWNFSGLIRESSRLRDPSIIGAGKTPGRSKL